VTANAGSMQLVEQLEARPRLRGVSHAGAFFVAIGAGLVLLAVTGGRWSVAIYVASLVAMLGISAAYHRGAWSARARRLWQRADHAAIFVFIAGTYTPMCVLAMPGSDGRHLLAAIWTGAGLGVLRALAWPRAPRWISSALYIAVGWTMVLALPAVLRATGPAVLAVILAGGLCYTAGAIIYALRRPDPWPRTFGYHEVFHALTLVAVVLHFGAVFTIAR
jgi:hemolysin III